MEIYICLAISLRWTKKTGIVPIVKRHIGRYNSYEEAVSTFEDSVISDTAGIVVIDVSRVEPSELEDVFDSEKSSNEFVN